MLFKKRKIRLVYVVLLTMLIVGVVPLILTGWFLAEKSGKELRALEGKYQIQLVQQKALQIEMFGQQNSQIVSGIAKAFEISQDFSLLSSQKTQLRLGKTLQENPDLLTLYVKPIKGESLSVFRSEVISKEEVESLANGILGRLSDKNIVYGKPTVLQSNGENVITIAAPVLENEKITAAVVGVISFNALAQMMSENHRSSEKDLWAAGLPIVFVVDEDGRAIFHPDPLIVSSQKRLDDLKIVKEWQESNRQIESALVPFSAEFDGKKFDLIGAYSTAKLSDEMGLGVITMQDESRALASVGVMKRQTWIISIALALITLLVGIILTKIFTKPVVLLDAAARKIASGDLSNRIEATNIKELNNLGDTFNLMSENLTEYIAKLAKAAEENQELFLGTIKALAAAIDGKDKYTRGHSERVARFSLAIGKRMGISADELEKLRISSLLHDVGKISIDDKILKKPAALTGDEYEIMKMHPQKGYKIMSQIPAMKDFLPGMYMHHEMINGEGYPQGLKGDEIPLQARIISVADTFDAMTTNRPYQAGMPLSEVLDRIKSFVGTRYDGKVVEALVIECGNGNIRPVNSSHPLKVTADDEQTNEPAEYEFIPNEEFDKMYAM